MRPDPDPLLIAIAAYAKQPKVVAGDRDIARCGFMEALARSFSVLRSDNCRRLVGPLIPGAMMPGGARVPGTSFELDPVQGAFSIGVLARDPRAHLADNLGGILAITDYLARKAIMEGKAPPIVRDLLTALVSAYQIQEGLGPSFLGSAFGRAFLTRVASTAVVTAMLGGNLEQITNAVSNAWLDGPALAGQEGGARERWAVADATSRAVRHALIALRGEMGYPCALTARTWGFCDVVLGGKALPGSEPLSTPLFATRLPQGIALDAGTARALLEVAVDDWFLPRQAERINAMFASKPALLDTLPVNELMAELVSHAARPEGNRQGKLPLVMPSPP
jgi:2-methylcitrate dehydratase PrpD